MMKATIINGEAANTARRFTILGVRTRHGCDACILSYTTFPGPVRRIKKDAKKRNCEDQRFNMNLISSNVSDNTKIGVFLMALGSLFLWLGVMFLFDSVLLGLGNVLFLSGFVFVFGFMKAARVLMKKSRLRFTVPFLGGILLVLLGGWWTFLGLFMEVFGFLNLFGNFFPLLLFTLRQVPYVGDVLNHKAIAPYLDRMVGSITVQKREADDIHDKV